MLSLLLVLIAATISCLVVVECFSAESHHRSLSSSKSLQVTRDGDNDEDDVLYQIQNKDDSQHQARQQRPSFGYKGRRSMVLSTFAASSSFLLGGMTSFQEPVNAAGTPSNLISVVLNSPDNKIGIQLADKTIQSLQGGGGEKMSVIVVKSTNPDGEAAAQGVEAGMVLSTKSKNASEIISKIRQGPYPMVFQFYSLSEDDSTTALQALEQAEAAAAAAAASKSKVKEPQGPLVSSKGAGLGVKTVSGGTKMDRKCVGAKRGDVLTIQYEARVASPGGPLYDGTNFARNGEPTQFMLGDGKAVNGVEIGVGGMCVGEIRELDIPAGLGYGKYGSDLFDIPGDVRLWWRIELLDLLPQQGRR